MPRGRYVLILVFFSLVYLSLRIYNINAPYEFCGSWLSIAARNYERFGMDGCGFVPCMGCGAISQDELQPYVHHPPLFSWLVYISYRLFGHSEMSGRMLVILFGLGCMLLTSTIATRLFGYKIGLLTAFIYCFIPFDIFFARLLLFDLAALFFALLLYLAYLKWLDKPAFSSPLVIMPLIIILGALTDWSFAWMLPVILLDYWLIRRRSKPRRLPYIVGAILIYSVIALAYIGLVHFIIDPQGRSYGGALLYAFLARSDKASEAVSWSHFFRLEIKRLFELYSPFAVIPALLELALSLITIAWRVMKRRAMHHKSAYMVLFFIFGFAHAVAFRQAAVIHENWYYAKNFFLVLAAAVFISRILSIIKPRYLKILVFIIPAAAYVYFCLGEALYLHHARNPRHDADLGRLMASRSEPDERLIATFECDPVIRYYSDRAIYCAVGDLRQFKALLSQHRSIALLFSRRFFPPARDLMDYLLENFEFETVGEAIIFDLNKTRAADSSIPVNPWLHCLNRGSPRILSRELSYLSLDLSSLNLPESRGLYITSFLVDGDSVPQGCRVLSIVIEKADGLTEIVDLIAGVHTGEIYHGELTAHSLPPNTKEKLAQKEFYIFRSLSFQPYYIYRTDFNFTSAAAPLSLDVRFDPDDTGQDYSIGITDFCLKFSQ